MKRKKYVAWLFLVPSLIFYLYFFVYPTINSFRISFYKWTGFSEEMEFVGWKNFASLLTDDNFHASLKATFLLIIVGGIGIFLLSFIFSLLLGSGIRGKKVYRSIIFFPFIVAPLIHSIYWGIVVYSPRNGMLNRILEPMNIKFAFLNSEHIFWSSLFVVVWMCVGFYLIILMAGIDRIPPYIFEAARLEGANEFQLFFRITLPLVKNVLSIAVILWVIMAIKMFDFFYAVGGIITPRALWTNVIYLFIVAFGKRPLILQLGYASAIGIFSLLLVIIFAIVIWRLFRGQNYEY